MRTHKSDKDMPDRKLYNHNKTVFVALDVKDIMLIPNVVSCGEICLYIRQVLPLCLLYDVVPSFKRSLSVSMSFRTIELN